MPGRAAKGAGGSRIRTESMIDRLGKKPLSEGYDLWDKDFLLGALRLFQCKLEVAPPFEVAPCFEAVGDILFLIDEKAEAAEHYDLGNRKFGMMSKKWGAALLQAKHTRSTDGAAAAVKELEKKLAPFDERLAQGCTTGADVAGSEAKGEVNFIANMYSLKAQCLLDLGDDETLGKAAAAAGYALTIGCDRPHLTHALKGEILLKQEKEAEAEAAYNASVKAKPCFVQGYEALLEMYTKTERHADALAVAQKASKEHPKVTTLRDEAFATAGTAGDAAALKLLDSAIANPPSEEGEEDPTWARGVLYKAKAAILADAGDFVAAAAACRNLSGDAEADAMLKQLIELCPEAAGGGKTEQELAAEKIQALQRGRQGRKAAEEKKKEVKQQVAVAKKEASADAGADTGIANYAQSRYESLGPGSPSVHDVSGVLHHDSELRQLFNKIDCNGNGWLSEKELTDYYLSIDHFGLDPDPSFIQKQLKEFGGDGRVTYDEFAVILLRIAAR